MADRPLEEFGFKTPLEAAKTPNMDKLVENGICGIMDPIIRCRAGRTPPTYPYWDTTHMKYTGRHPLKPWVLA